MQRVFKGFFIACGIVLGVLRDMSKGMGRKMVDCTDTHRNYCTLLPHC